MVQTRMVHTVRAGAAGREGAGRLGLGQGSGQDGVRGKPGRNQGSVQEVRVGG